MTLSGLRHAGIDATARALAACRADRWMAPLAAGNGVVLTFHRVRPPPPPSSFAPNLALEVAPETLLSTIDLLARAKFDVVTLDEAVARMRAPTARRFAALTFDDGYRDNFEVAAPLLARKGIPWTVFVVPDFLSGLGRAWWLDLERVVAALDLLVVRDRGQVVRHPSRTTGEKLAAFSRLGRRLHAVDDAARARILNALAKDAGLARRGLGEDFANWDELAVAAKNDALTIGSHTSGHKVLSGVSSAVAIDELHGSRMVLEARLGRPVRHLSYPHGDPRSIGRREVRLARCAGYESAWTTRPGHVFQADSRCAWSLPRVSVNGAHASPAMLRVLLSGAAFPLGRWRPRWTTPDEHTRTRAGGGIGGVAGA